MALAPRAERPDPAFVEHHTHWSNFKRPPPHDLAFDALLECLVAGLAELGVVVEPSQLTFACMPALGRRGSPLPPADLLLDRTAAAEHHAALVEAGCLVVEIRGAGWLPDGATSCSSTTRRRVGSEPSFPAVWAEQRGTVWPLSVAWFERLERNDRLRPFMHRLARRRWRAWFDIPVRPAWNVGRLEADQGCPTVALPGRS